jgi:Na+/phosphate symporter
MRGLTFIGALSMLFLLSHSAVHAQVPKKSQDSVKAMEQAAVRMPDSTLKTTERVIQRGDSTAVPKPVERSSSIRTLERETHRMHRRMPER